MEHKREYFLIYLFILLLFTFYLIVLSIYFKYFVYIFRTQYQNTRFSLLATFLRVNRHIYICMYISKERKSYLKQLKPRTGSCEPPLLASKYYTESQKKKKLGGLNTGRSPPSQPLECDCPSQHKGKALVCVGRCGTEVHGGQEFPGEVGL